MTKRRAVYGDYRNSHRFTYNGIIFRSRTEAQWAYFLDWLKVRYAYEAITYILPDGRAYTPDFYLHDFSIHLEVKPVNTVIRSAERGKADTLAAILNTERIWITYGAPAWFEQLAGPKTRAIEKAIFAPDQSCKTLGRHHETPTPCLWVLDEAHICRNRLRPHSNISNHAPPDPLLITPDTAHTCPVNPFENPFMLEAITAARAFNLPDRFSETAYHNMSTKPHTVRYAGEREY